MIGLQSSSEVVQEDWEEKKNGGGEVSCEERRPNSPVHISQYIAQHPRTLQSAGRKHFGERGKKKKNTCWKDGLRRQMYCLGLKGGGTVHVSEITRQHREVHP